MSNHWSYEAKRPQGGIILISLLANGEKIGLLYGLDKTIEEYARLIIAAPDMYRLMKSVVDFDYTAFKFDTNGNLIFTREKYDEFRDLLVRIDGEEANS